MQKSQYITNKELAKVLYGMTLYLEMQDEFFRSRAFEKAARSIESLEEDIMNIYKKGGIAELEKIPGVGQGIAERIEEFIKTGHIKDYDKLHKEISINIEELTAIEGVGPKMVKALYTHLKIKNLKDLEKAARAGKIRKLPHFKEKTEKNILKGIEFFKKHAGRFVLGFILPEVKAIEARLQKLPEVKRAIVAGSVRRMKETVGDADILIVSSRPEKVMDFFTSMDEVAHIYGKGKTKSAVKLKNGMDMDLRVVEEKSFGAALVYFTGSKDHNFFLRKIAQKKRLKLNEYGLFKRSKTLKLKSRWIQIAGETEEEIYALLGLNYIEPELRENAGEIETARLNFSKKNLGGQARTDKLPKLISYQDLKGDLQIQTNWTDGANSIEEMAKKAIKLGLEYIAITDHTKSLAMTGGSDEKKLLKQMEYIDKLNSKIQIANNKFKILKGAEVNILKDERLDINDKVLAKLDVVGAAVHSNFNMSGTDMTKRICRAMRNPHVDIIFHPTGRLINKRPAYELDIDKIIKAAKETGTVLEIDAFPNRLDLKDNYIRKCVNAGVKLVINSDAHSVNHIHYLYLGIAQARRGWAEKKDIINTLPLEKFLQKLK